MEIEQLSLQNIEQLIELVLECWEDTEFEEELRNYKSILSSSDQMCYLYKEGELYIGFLHVSTRNDYVEGADVLPVAYIEGIYIKPAYRKQGMAGRLIGLAEMWAKEKGYKQLASDTEMTNSISIALHKKQGFSEAGRIVCFIKDLSD